MAKLKHYKFKGKVRLGYRKKYAGVETLEAIIRAYTMENATKKLKLLCTKIYGDRKRAQEHEFYFINFDNLQEDFKKTDEKVTKDTYRKIYSLEDTEEKEYIREPSTVEEIMRLFHEIEELGE